MDDDGQLVSQSASHWVVRGGRRLVTQWVNKCLHVAMVEEVVGGGRKGRLFVI